jgi:hypothetical protein
MFPLCAPSFTPLGIELTGGSRRAKPGFAKLPLDGIRHARGEAGDRRVGTGACLGSAYR